MIQIRIEFQILIIFTDSSVLMSIFYILSYRDMRAFENPILEAWTSNYCKKFCFHSLSSFEILVSTIEMIWFWTGISQHTKYDMKNIHWVWSRTCGWQVWLMWRWGKDYECDGYEVRGQKIIQIDKTNI